MLICPSHVLSHALVTLPDAPAKIKRGGHFGVLTGMWIFQPRTVHRATNSGKPQVKIRLEFHFVERKNEPVRGTNYFISIDKDTRLG